jgi:uncharacterized repeat protein (TIGR03847 family)
MTTSFDLPAPDAFAAGTVGPPGRRVFYLQAREGDLVVTLRCEKQQVAALADYFEGLLGDLPPDATAQPLGDVQLTEPIEAAWTVGPIGVAYDDEADRIVVVFEELVDDPDTAGATLRLRLTRAQVAAFVSGGRELVSAGRPNCRFCGLPIDPEGHPCPRMN